MKITKHKLRSLINESIKKIVLKETVVQRGLKPTLQQFIDDYGNEFFLASANNANIGRRDFGGTMFGAIGHISGNLGNIEMIKRVKPVMLPIVNPITGQPVFNEKGEPAKFPYFPVSKHQANGPVRGTGRPHAVYYGNGENDYAVILRPEIIGNAKSAGLRVVPIGDPAGLWVRTSNWDRLIRTRPGLQTRLELEMSKVLKANQNISIDYVHRDACRSLQAALN